MKRRTFLASLPTALARAAGRLPASDHVRWALSSALWTHFRPVPFTEILDVMRDTGFIGLRLAGFPKVLEDYRIPVAQLEKEVSRRNLHIVTISFSGPFHDPSQRAKVLGDARRAIEFLASFGANHLTVFSPGRLKPGADVETAFRELCARYNQIGELARGSGFTAGVHNHLGQMVEGPEEVERCLSLTDPSLFGFSPDTAHLHLAGCRVVETVNRHKERIRFLDYKDARWTTPKTAWTEENGTTHPADSPEARFLASIYDLGDGEIDFPGCHRALKSMNYRGWICVDLDTARHGPTVSYQRCGAYVTGTLEPIYK